MSVFQGELIDDPDEVLDVRCQLRELLLVGCALFFQLSDLLEQPSFRVCGLTSFLDLGVDVVLEVGMALGECVAWHLGLLGQGDDRERAVGVLGSAGEDAVHGGADACALVEGWGHGVASAVVMRWSWCRLACAWSLVALRRSLSASGVGRRLARCSSWRAWLSVRAMLAQAGMQ
ncbi:hypothetical protein AB0L67_25165 [Streptomyces flaveolus]|uniref:hypothetical protein n=1 Tax=Streptomyces flaveolus TaxID=67297 RepID=UPI00341D86A1